MLQTGRDKDRQRFSTFLAEVELDRRTRKYRATSSIERPAENSGRVELRDETAAHHEGEPPAALAHAPFPEKIAARIERQRGRMVKGWSLPVRSETLMLHKKPYLKRTLITALVQPKAIEQ